MARTEVTFTFIVVKNRSENDLYASSVPYIIVWFVVKSNGRSKKISLSWPLNYCLFLSNFGWKSNVRNWYNYYCLFTKITWVVSSIFALILLYIIEFQNISLKFLILTINFETFIKVCQWCLARNYEIAILF